VPNSRKDAYCTSAFQIPVTGLHLRLLDLTCAKAPCNRSYLLMRRQLLRGQWTRGPQRLQPCPRFLAMPGAFMFSRCHLHPHRAERNPGLP